MSTFLTSDLQLFSREEAKSAKQSVKGYNKKIIKTLNSFLKKNDTLLLNGEISQGGTEETIELLKELNCKIIFFGKKNFSIYMDKLEGCDTMEAIYADGFQKSKYRDMEIIISDDQRAIVKAYRSRGPAQYMAIPNSIIKSNKIINDNNIINTSFKVWNYEPIKLGEDFAVRIDNLELFEKMENEEVILNE